MVAVTAYGIQPRLVPPNKVEGTHEYKTGNSNYHTIFLSLLLYPFRLSLSLYPSGLTRSSLFLSWVTVHTRHHERLSHPQPRFPTQLPKATSAQVRLVLRQRFEQFVQLGR